jgi:hypothetical protein
MVAGGNRSSVYDSSENSSFASSNIRKQRSASTLSDISSPIEVIRRDKRRIGPLRDRGELNRNWSVATDIFLLRIQMENPYPRPDVQEMIAISLFQEVYGESGDLFDLREIGDTEIRIVKYLHFYTRSGLIVGYLVGGLNIHC